MKNVGRSDPPGHTFSFPSPTTLAVKALSQRSNLENTLWPFTQNAVDL